MATVTSTWALGCTMVGNYIPPGIQITLHSENGMLGVDRDPLEQEVICS